MCNMMFFSVVLTQGLLLLAISIIVFNLLAQRPYLSTSSTITSSAQDRATHKESPAPTKQTTPPLYNHDKLRNFICEDDDVVSHIQKELWMKAYVEVFDGEKLPQVNDKDMRFYQEAYGTVNLHLPYNRHNYSELVYYRIYKVGNDNIRSFLFEYAFNKTNNIREYYKLGCPADRCTHPWVTRGGMTALRARTQPFPPNRFAFTFVRHPIVRFISAMNEIETRAHGNVAKQTMLQLRYPVGSMERVMEFIQMILKTGGSGDYYRIYENIEYNHVAPMYGTLSLARALESTKMHVYKLEQLGGEWKRMSRELGDGLLSRIFVGKCV
ncbi:hypothetical protein EON63_01535 [archaeon]|nr:MAG: hypothetical protein EON63_01535 [archaeon]